MTQKLQYGQTIYVYEPDNNMVSIGRYIATATNPETGVQYVVWKWQTLPEEDCVEVTRLSNLYESVDAAKEAREARKVSA